MEVCGLLHDIAEEYEVEIEGARSIRVRALAAICAFDGEKMTKQLTCGERRLADDDRVQIGRLLLESLADRIGFDNTGEREIR